MTKSLITFFNKDKREEEGWPNLGCHTSKVGVLLTTVWAATEGKMGNVIALSETCRKYNPFFFLPKPILLQVTRSCMKQKCERKNTQHDGKFVSFEMGIRLNEKEGTQRTSVRNYDAVTWTVPI